MSISVMPSWIFSTRRKNWGVTTCDLIVTVVSTTNSLGSIGEVVMEADRAKMKATYGYWKGTRWRGCPYVPFPRLTKEQQGEARKRFSPKGRREGWENIEWWAFCVRSDGKLAKCQYIEPVGPPTQEKASGT